jgi:hypothetical protein
MTEWLWCLYDGDGMQKTAARHRRQDKGDGGSRTTANNGEADGFDDNEMRRGQDAASKL